MPTAAPRTQREALGDIAAAAGVPVPRVSVLGPRALRAAGLFVPMLRELAGTSYQFTSPFVVDDRATVDLLGWPAQDWARTVDGVVAAARTSSPAEVR